MPVAPQNARRILPRHFGRKPNTLTLQSSSFYKWFPKNGGPSAIHLWPRHADDQPQVIAKACGLKNCAFAATLKASFQEVPWIRLGRDGMAGTSDIKSDIEGWKAGSGRLEVIPRSNEKVHISRIGRKELDPFVGPLDGFWCHGWGQVLEWRSLSGLSRGLLWSGNTHQAGAQNSDLAEACSSRLRFLVLLYLLWRWWHDDGLFWWLVSTFAAIRSRRGLPDGRFHTAESDADDEDEE